MNADIHLSRHLLETLAIDADSSHAPEARRHLTGCRDCASRLDNIVHARAGYLLAYPAKDFAQQVLVRAQRARRPVAANTTRRRWLAGLGGFALALGALALLLTSSRRAPDEIRLKGGASWSVFANRGTRTWAPSEGETLQPGDQLAFAYNLAQDRYFVLLGIDDAGTVTAYGPEGAPTVRLGRGLGRLPFAIKLDARPGQEQLIGLFSQAPLDVAAARQALASAAVRVRGQDRTVIADDLAVPAQIVTFAFKKR